MTTSPAPSRPDHHAARLHRVDRVETVSTLDDARLWSHAHPGETGLIVTARQTGGRGRLGRAWDSPEGGAWITLVLPARGDRIPPASTLAGALGAAEAIDECLSEADPVAGEAPMRTAVRWPNDLLLGGRKVGGMLGESFRVGPRATFLLGVGINVNNEPPGADRELRTPATSLARVLGRPVDLDRFVDRLAARIARAVRACFDHGLEGAGRARLEARLLDRGRRVRLTGAGDPVEGVVRGLDASGGLLLEIDGECRRFVSGELSCRGVDEAGRGGDEDR
jgi:BirA family biotin operon repressor/biotin-[acetyl-CoA-carboxylase] ligase